VPPAGEESVMWNGYRLLVIEDDDALCESIADVLRATGYEVETAQDADDALQLLRDEPAPDAILLDMVLQTTTAAQLLEDIDARSYPHPPVVLMTGMLPRPGLAPHGEAVLLKPFGIDELLAHVQRACGRPTYPWQAPSDAAPP
ncbi:MAG TPA: response regulator, partial [Anaeromyxobacteraceae bacterium]